MNDILLPGQAAAPEGPADMRMMYLLHHGFRRDLAHFTAAARLTPATDRAAWSALVERWDLFAELLHDHHKKEDDVLWPFLSERARAASDDAALRVLEEMEAEHALIDPLLESTRAALAMQASTPADEAGRAGLVVLLERTTDVLDGHLGHEEQDAISILQRHVTGEEWTDLERRKLRGGLKPRTLLKLLPWVTQDVDQSVVAPLLAEAGAPFRIMLRLGRRGFGQLQSQAFAHVPAGTGAAGTGAR